MIYVADLDHDNLLKVGITGEHRARACPAELRRDLNEPRLKVFIEAIVPRGWGTDRQWERKLLRNLLSRGNRLQMFAREHKSIEVVEATRDEAHAELLLMLRSTEIDPRLHAWQLDSAREDWRFDAFLWRYPGTRGSQRCWNDPIMRQAFLYWIRDEPSARWERQGLGYSCWEIDEIYSADKT